AVGRLADHVEAVLREQRGEGLARERVIVDEQDPFSHPSSSSAGARLPMRGNVERGHSDQYGSWLIGELLVVLLLGSTVALFVRYPSLQDSYLLPQGRLVLDTSVSLIAAIVAVLAGIRFSVEGRRVDLFLCAAFGVTAMGTLAFEVAP